MHTLTADMLAQVLQEPEKALLARCLRQLGQERCAQVLVATLEVEANGGMARKDGGGRKSAGGTFFQLIKDSCSAKQRFFLFRFQASRKPPKPSGSSGTRQAPPAPALAPLSLTISLWKGLTSMPVTATLKLVLRDLPETREKDGMVYLALQNEPKGLPKNITLESGPLYLTSPVKQWSTACTRAAEIRATGTSALLIIEAHVSTREGALIGVVKAIQCVEGKAAVAPSASR